MIMGGRKQAGGINHIDADRRAVVRGLGLATGIAAAAAAGAFLLVASPAKSADLVSNQVAISVPDVATMLKDPVHQAALKASADHKIVIVLGEGFNKFSMKSLNRHLTEMGLTEGKHYEIMTGASAPKAAGVLYVGGQLVRTQMDGPAFVFLQNAEEDALLIIRQAIKAGTITVATLDLGH